MKQILFLILLTIFSNVNAQIIDKMDVRLLYNESSEANKKVVIVLKEKADLTEVRNIKGKDAKATMTYNLLYNKAQDSQKGLIDFLKENRIAYRSFYIVNMISATCNRDFILKLAQRDDVDYIIEDSKFTMLQQPERGNNTAGERTPVWGLNKIGAPTVWSMGYTGQNVVIGGQDTGYAWEISTIKNKYRGWNGTSADHDYNWHDAIHTDDPLNGTNPCGINSTVPCDDHNHGTHTMGTMVGDTDNNGNEIGVAPGAKWIGCRNMESGAGTLSTYVECFEWFLAPYPVSGGQGDPTKMPHVINNSWGCPPSEGCNTTNFDVMEMALNNLRNAGCVVVVSAGNSGSNCSSVNDPAAIFEGSFSVGATNSSDDIAGFSSRGAVTVDGSNRLKPNVSAPGVNVRSCIKDGTFTEFSGTSMAGPHVAGLVALIISANPELAGEVDQIEDIIEQTATRLTSSQICNGISGNTIPNNTYGFGRINAVAAVNRALDKLYVPFIKVDQFGYQSNSQKVAVLSNPINGYNNASHYAPSSTISVKNSSTHTVVYSGSCTAWNNGATHDQSGDKVWWFDFSSVTTPGKYYIADNNDGGIRSEDFEIRNDIYEEIYKAAFKTFYYQRCGVSKSTSYADTGFTDNACHLQDVNCKYIDDPNNASLYKNMSGGWHDAGDYNKYVNFSYKPLLDLLWSYEINSQSLQSDDMNIPESGNSIPDLLDEIKIELDWLLKMQANDGGVHCVVGVQNFASASPPSSDNATRYYAPKTTSATRSTSAVFAFAAKQFYKINNSNAQSFATTLKNKAIEAWDWSEYNPNQTYYNANHNLASGEQEVGTYEMLMRKIVAAVYLYDLTGENKYRDFVQNNYSSSHMIQWGYVYPFENIIQLSLLHFSFLKDVSTTVANSIRNAYKNSMDASSDHFPSWNNNTDAYRSYLSTQNTTWGSNETKCNQAGLFQEYDYFDLDVSKKSTIKNITESFIHYIHGINPNALTYMTNMRKFGANRSVNTVYHSWFTDGSSSWDDVRTSTYGPAPGFIPGGANPNWALDACCPNNCGGQYNSQCIMLAPPSGQPVLKSYYDWNTGWPQNSWTVTEVAIYTQASYLKLLSSMIQPALSSLPVQNQVHFNTDAYIKNNGRGIILTSENGSHYRIKAENNGRISTELVNTIPANSILIHNAYLKSTTSQKGCIVKAPDNGLWQIFVGKNGSLNTVSTTVPSSNFVESMNGDVVVSDTGYGWILKNQDNICFLITVSNSGRLQSKPINCD